MITTMVLTPQEVPVAAVDVDHVLADLFTKILARLKPLLLQTTAVGFELLGRQCLELLLHLVEECLHAAFEVLRLPIALHHDAETLLTGARQRPGCT